MAEFSYNNSVHSFTKETPFYLAYGTHPQMPDSLHFSSSINIPLARERAEKFVNLCLHWDKQSLESRQHAGKYYSAGHTPKNFKFGDLVWLSARNIRTCRPSKKLDYKFHGLFRILKCIGTKPYQLDIPEV